MYKPQETKLLLEKTVWEVLVEAAERIPPRHGWVKKDAQTRGKLKLKYKDVYSLQCLTTSIEQIMYLYIDLLFCGISSNCSNCFSKFSPLDTVIWMFDELSDVNSAVLFGHNHKYWHEASSWARKKTVDEFINEFVLFACTDTRCAHHTEKATATAAALTPIVQDYFASFIDGLVMLSVCGNYNSGPGKYQQTPTESGTIVCRNLFLDLKFMIGEVLSDAQLMQELQNETDEGNTETEDEGRDV
jgi:hypothetical protein